MAHDTRAGRGVRGSGGLAGAGIRGQVPFAASEEAKSSNPEKRTRLSDVKVSVSTVPLDTIGAGSREPLNSAISCIVSPAPS
jgi:hypothetical protein